MTDRVFAGVMSILVLACIAMVTGGVIYDLRHPCLRYEIRTRHEEAFPGIAIGLMMRNPAFYAMEHPERDVEYSVCVEKR